MIATRTLPSSRWALPLLDATDSSGKLLADVQDALDDREPGRRREDEDRPGQAAPRCEDEAGRDDHDALCARAESDVATQAERLGLGAGVRDEEGADHRGYGEHDGPLHAVAREDECNRREHRSLADAVGRGV